MTTMTEHAPAIAAPTPGEQAVAAGFAQWLKPLTLTKVTVTVDPTDGYLVATVQYKYEKDKNEQSVKIKTAILSRSGDVILEVGN